MERMVGQNPGGLLSKTFAEIQYSGLLSVTSKRDVAVKGISLSQFPSSA